MRIQVVVLASLLATGAAQAQSVPSPTPASDSWSAPAPASTAGYHAPTAPVTGRERASHFKFKEPRGSYTPPHANAAQQHSGNAAVGAMGGMDRNGRPAVSCPQTPMDPACH